MLDQSTRTAILRLHEQGHGSRAIAETLGVSRGAVKKVLRLGRAEVPPLDRAEKAEPHREQILTLFKTCKGNLVRVYEELRAQGATFSYPALTAFCRRHRIGYAPPPPAGRYDFAPGEEMQHDTSPHRATIGGRTVAVQTASVTLCFSRMLFVQCYPRFNRFACKVFLTDALRFFGGAAERCVIDNTHVIVLRGTGRDMVPVPEMAAFADRFGFQIVAHALGHANRSARVERPFDHIENNFLAGRTFADWDDINAQALAWCERVNAAPRRHLHASARELFAIEQSRLRPLPLHVPEVYALHHRIVDTEGYVNVQCNRYSVPWELIARPLEVREYKDRIEVYDGPRLVASHKRRVDGLDERVTDPRHRPPRGQGPWARSALSVARQRLCEREPRLAPYLDLLRSRGRGSIRDVRVLTRMLDEYPRDALVSALDDAHRYGLTDLERLERMVLRRIAHDFFVLPSDARTESDETDDEDDDDDR